MQPLVPPVRVVQGGVMRVSGSSGFLLAHWCGDGACEERVRQETKATIRCLAFDQPDESGACLICGGASSKRAHFAKAY